MKQLSAEECIARILRDIDKRRTLDCADKNAVRRFNAAMDRIIERANYFCDNYPDKMEMFLAFLDHPDEEIAVTFTTVLAGLHHATREHKLAAIASAKRFLAMRPGTEFIWGVNIAR